MRVRLPRWLLLGVLGVGSLLSLPAGAGESKACIPEFPFKDGWWGADAAYSIPLPDGRTVWIFGDTLYGRERHVEGIVPRMVRNSIGISTCESNGNWTIEYVIRGAESGQPRDFFESRDPSYWYWALDGFLHGETLWVTLLCIRHKEGATSEVFSFETCGADLAKVTHLGASPQEWAIEYFPLVPDGVGAYPSATAVVEGEYAYIFALYEEGSRPMVLTRLPLARLEDPAENLEYLAGDGTWKSGLVPSQAKPVMDRGASEMSVRYHSGRQEWLAVMINPDLPSEEVFLRTAKSLRGPWTASQVLYRIPDMRPTSPTYDPDTFCYAAKEHPQYRQPGKILLTYVCNTMKVKKLETNLSIYFPKAVLVGLPAED